MNETALQSIREVLLAVENDADEAGRKAGMEAAAKFIESFATNLLAEGRRDDARLCLGLANRIRALVRAGMIW